MLRFLIVRHFNMLHRSMTQDLDEVLAGEGAQLEGSAK